MWPRITGTEMEYGVLIQREPGSKFEGPLGFNNSIVTHHSPLKNRIGSFFENGCRFYADIGEHIEYATPEDTSIKGTVANEIAGERIAYGSLKNAQQAGRFHDFKLNKRVLDDNGVTWGHHENFLVPRDKVAINSASLALLGLHLATVNLFTGAGAVVSSPDGQGRYVIGQKALDLEQDFSGATTKHKPLVNLRDEPHATASKWARVHVTSGDANMSPWAMRMKLGTTSLVLSLTEHGYDFDHLRVRPLLYHMGLQVATDLTMKKTVQLVDHNKSIRPIDIQTELMLAAKNLSTEVAFSDEELWVVDEWERACDDLMTDPALLADRADWVAKGHFLVGYRQKHGLKWGSKVMKAMDKQWDNLDPSGIGQRLRRGMWAKWMPSEALIAIREIEPPDTTRATIRGHFITRFAHTVGKLDANWNHVKHNDKVFQLNDPYATRDKAVDKLLWVA